MKQYLDLLQNILDNGVEKESGRANMPNTIGISNGIIKMDLSEGFPLLTTKKMAWKMIIHELLWFLRGDTNIKYLVDNNVHIWDGDAYRFYTNKIRDFITPDESIKCLSQEEFIEKIKQGDLKPIIDSETRLFREYHKDYKLGDLGKVYGYQWRNQNGIDQIKELLEGKNSLLTNPYSRYHIINAWNAADFEEMALPPCHLMYQFIVRPLTLKERQEYFFKNIFNNDKKKFYKKLRSIGSDKKVLELMDETKVPKFYLDLNMYQRSVDTALGCPFNIASMSLLLMIFSKTCNMIPGVSTWMGGDTHLYINHIDLVKEQLKRSPYKLPKLTIKKDLKNLNDIVSLSIDDFELTDYECYEKIPYELSTGNKKV